jgi:hypothetical protein
MPNSASGNSRTRAERLRLYRRRFPGPGQPRKVRITDENIIGLVKRGYLGANERDDTQAIKEAVSLFLWDALVGVPQQTARH